MLCEHCQYLEGLVRGGGIDRIWLVHEEATWLFFRRNKEISSSTNFRTKAGSTRTWLQLKLLTTRLKSDTMKDEINDTTTPIPPYICKFRLPERRGRNLTSEILWLMRLDARTKEMEHAVLFMVNSSRDEFDGIWNAAYTLCYTCLKHTLVCHEGETRIQHEHEGNSRVSQACGGTGG